MTTPPASSKATLDQVVRHPVTWVLAALMLVFLVLTIALSVKVAGGAASTNGSSESSAASEAEPEATEVLYSMKGEPYRDEYGSILETSIDELDEYAPGCLLGFHGADDSTAYLNQVRACVSDEYFAQLVERKAMAPDFKELKDSVVQRQVVAGETTRKKWVWPEPKGRETQHIEIVDTLKDGSQRRTKATLTYDYEGIKFEWGEGTNLKSIRQTRVTGDPVIEEVHEGE